MVLDNIKSQIANRWPRSWPSSGRTAIRSADVPRGVRPRALRHPASRQPLVDASPSGRWPARRAAGSALEEKLLKRVRAFAHVDDRDRAPAYRRCSRRRPVVRGPLAGRATHRPDAACSRSGPTAVATTQSTKGSQRSANERAAADELAQSSTSPSRRPPRRCSTCPEPSPTSRCRSTLDTSARRSSRRWTIRGIPTACAKASGTPRREHRRSSSSRSRSPSPTTRPRPCTATTRSARRCFIGSPVDDLGRLPTGQRYISGSSTVLLFAARKQKDEFGTRPTSSWARRTTSATRASALSRSPGELSQRHADRLLHCRVRRGSVIQQDLQPLAMTTALRTGHVKRGCVDIRRVVARERSTSAGDSRPLQVQSAAAAGAAAALADVAGAGGAHLGAAGHAEG